MKRCFNVVAVIIRRLLEEKISARDLQSALENREGKIRSVFARKFPELFDQEGRSQSFELADLTEEFYVRLEKFAVKEKIWLLAVFLHEVEYVLWDCQRRRMHFEEEVEVYQALNSNTDITQIAIIPKVGCKWEHRMITEGASVILRKFYYIDLKKFDGDYKIYHYDIENKGLLKDKNTLKIAISPLTKDKVVEFSEPYDTKNEHTGASQLMFRVENVCQEEELTKRVINITFLAGTKGIDILVFPEMLGTSKMLKKALETIKYSGKSVPSLIVFPSIWKKTEDDENNENSCPVIFRGQEILFFQKKYGHFHYEKNGRFVYEDINRKGGNEKVFHLIHIEGIGRICILICYDFLTAEMRKEIVENLRPTLIFTPSFSTGSFNFQILAQHAFEQSCNWAWCNTCSAIHETDKKQNFETTGVITTLHRRCDLKIPESIQKRFPGVTGCSRNDCEECMYLAEIPLED